MQRLVMRALLGVALSFALLAAPAFAQNNSGGGFSLGGAGGGGGGGSITIGNQTGTSFGTASGSALTGLFTSGLTDVATITTSKIAVGGATIGANGLAVAGTSLFTGVPTFQPAADSTGAFLAKQNGGSTYFALDSTNRNIYAGGFGSSSFTIGAASGRMVGFSGAIYGWTSNAGSSDNNAPDTMFTRGGVATLQHGAADAAAPVAQIEQTQSVVAGTPNTVGQNWTINGSRGTGTGVGGDIVFQMAKAGTTGSAQNALTEGFRIAADNALPKWPASSTGAGAQTFTNSPCTGLTTERWVQIEITGQTGIWNVPACQ